MFFVLQPTLAPMGVEILFRVLDEFADTERRCKP